MNKKSIIRQIEVKITLLEHKETPMNDRERLVKLLERLNRLDGLDQALYEKLIHDLDRPVPASGYDEDGRLVITMFDAKSYDVESFSQQNRGRFTLRAIEAPLNEDSAIAASGSKVVCIFVNDRCDAPVVARLAALGIELIALRCAGYNNVDLKACQQHRISVVRVPAYSPHAVAEYSVALMLMLNRHLHKAYMRNRAGYFVLEGLIGFDMRGKTVGVIGTGRIGQCVIEILLGFGCNVLAFDKFPDPKVASRGNVQYHSLEKVLTESDIITLHAPLTDETYHMINSRSIACMKRGVMLINTSRGGLVDARALIDGLKSGRIGSAGLDVYEEEAGIFFHDVSDKGITDELLAQLLAFSNVVITSHQAFFTREALANIATTTLANIEEFIQGKRGKELLNAVEK